jgi:hypothetical protein
MTSCGRYSRLKSVRYGLLSCIILACCVACGADTFVIPCCRQLLERRMQDPVKSTLY